MKESTRAYYYRIVTAITPLLTAYGIVEDAKVPLILGVAAAVLGTGLAVANTSTQ